MRTRRTYRIALFLLLVFSANTVLAAACALSASVHGWHHHQAAPAEQHEHRGGQKHAHAHNGHHHDAPLKQQPEEPEDCCSGKVVALDQADKSTVRAIEVPVAFLLPALLPGYLVPDGPAAARKPRRMHPVRWRPPATIPDLRILIQSFQI